MNWRSFAFLALVTTILFSLASFSSGYAAKPEQAQNQSNSGPVLCALSVPNFSSFPTVSLNLRMLDSNSLPIIPVKEDLRFSENGNVPVPIVGNVQENNDIGIDYYVLIDKGNRTPAASVKSILQTFSLYHYSEGKDSIKIYTNENNGVNLYYPGTSGNTLAQAVDNYPLYNDQDYRQIQKSLETVLRGIESNIDPCQRSRVVLIIAGKDTLEGIDKNKLSEYSRRIAEAKAKLMFFHIGDTFSSRDIYTHLVEGAGGIYKPVLSLEDDITPVLNQTQQYRRSFSVSYRSNYGKTGAHNVSAFYQGNNIALIGPGSYQIEIRPPRVSISGPTWIERIREDNLETQTSSYSIDNATYTVNIAWDDSYPREINQTAKLIIVEEGKPGETTSEALLERQGDGTYTFIWNFSDKTEYQRTKFELSVVVNDEFGNIGISEGYKVDFYVTKTGVDVVDFWKYLVYGLGASVVLLIILMLFSWIFFRSQMRSMAARGGAMVGKIAGEIRKTLVGGAQRGKPLAILKVLEGPPTMIGQELKVFAESVKLGRNPMLADMTFYGPDILTSVSGLHARLEKISGNWRVVAISESRSETFIDEQPLNFHEPAPIRDGQKIRMGYPAQQPVILLFSATAAEQPRKTLVGGDNPRTTDVSMSDVSEKTKPGFYKPADKKTSEKDTDSIFDEFR